MSIIKPDPLLPDPTPAPLEGRALENFLHNWIAGVTGLPGAMVRPAWQPEPPNLPSVDTDWAAFRVQNRSADTFIAEVHSPDVGGYNEIRRHEVLDIKISFYGPNADNFAHLLREGMQVGQNREILTVNDFGVVGSGDVVPAPELVKDKWYYRADTTIQLRRQIKRIYGVKSILSSEVQLNNELYTTTIEVKEPTP